MELTNSSYIVTTEQGNIVVNPNSTTEYKNLTLTGSGYYDWGKVLAQNLAYLADKVYDLLDSGVEQATFDATQFIQQFQDAQTTALNAHTENLLIAIDNKVTTKLTELGNVLSGDFSSIISRLDDLDTAYVVADVALKTELSNTLNNTITTKINEVNTNLNTLFGNTGSFTIWQAGIDAWKASVEPKITNFSSSFDTFKTLTQNNFNTVNTSITNNYNELKGLIDTINNTPVSYDGILNEAKTYTDTKIIEKVNAYDLRLEDIETDISTNTTNITSVINKLDTNTYGFLTPTNQTILGDSKTYTNTEISKITGSTGSLTTLINNVSALKTTVDALPSRINIIDNNTTGTVAILNNKVDTYITNNETDLSNINTDISTKYLELKGKINTIESDYEAMWQAYTSTAIDTVEETIGGLDTRITTNANDITTINNTLSSLTGSSSNAVTDVSDLKTRVTTLENNSVTKSYADTGDTNTLTAAKTYTDTEIGKIDFATGDTNALNAAKTYTDTELGKLDTISQGELDLVATDVNNLTTTVEKIKTETIVDIYSQLDILNNAANNSTNLINGKILSVYQLLNNNNNYMLENMISYDLIFPILKKLFGYVIENKITKTESDTLFDNIMNSYKDEAGEIEASNIKICYYIKDGLVNLQIILSKKTYKSLINLNYIDALGIYNVTSFVGNLNTNIITETINTNYLLSGSGVNNYALQLSDFDINYFELNISYLNELNITTNSKLTYNFLEKAEIFNFRDLVNENNSLVIYLEIFSTIDKNYTITSILGDSTELTLNENYFIGPINTLNDYYSYTVKIILGEISSYYIYMSTTSYKSIELKYSLNNDLNIQTNQFYIVDYLDYGIGATTL